MLCITNNSSKHHSFVYTKLNDKIILFLTIQFSISHLFPPSLNANQFYSTNRLEPIRCYHSGSEWAWEQWQWRGIPHFPKLQIYWGICIRWFSVICRTLVLGWIMPHFIEGVGVFYSHSRLGLGISIRTDWAI